MPVTDTVADMLTRVRNAGMAKHSRLNMPNSRMTEAIAKILKQEGFIKHYKVIPATPQSTLQIDLKYTKERHPKHVINGHHFNHAQRGYHRQRSPTAKRWR